MLAPLENACLTTLAASIEMPNVLATSLTSVSSTRLITSPNTGKEAPITPAGAAPHIAPVLADLALFA